MTRFSSFASAFLLTLGIADLGEAAEKRPNVLLIVVDDLRPWLGCYGREGKTRRFEVAHRSLQPSEARVALFRLPFLAELGLVEEREMQQPHNALFIPEAHFRIHMPPRRLGGEG